MFSSYKIIFMIHIIVIITRHACRIVGKTGAKHISLAENAPTAHILNYLTIDINSQDPYLLGFDSNLIPNFNILLFQPYPGEDSEYSEESGGFACISVSPLGNTPNIWEIHLTGLISYRIQQGSLQIPNTSIICWIQKE